MAPTVGSHQGKQRRLRHRLFKHQLPLGALSALCAVVLYLTRPYSDVVSRASFATAYPALALLSATLLIGPWNLLRRQPNPVSQDLRRDLGIWAGILGVLHAAVGQWVHLRGRPWLYYVYGPGEHHHGFPLRNDLFGLANFTGAAGVLLLIVLSATSSDYCLRALGTPRWKQLQRWNYAVFALTGVHAVGYLLIEKQKASFSGIVAGCLVIAAGMQAAGFMQRSRRAARNASFEHAG